MDKLEESGWADGLSSLSNDTYFLWLPEVRKFEPLTPTGESIVAKCSTQVTQPFQSGPRYVRSLSAGCERPEKI